MKEETLKEYQRFKKILYPRSTSFMRRPDYLHNDDVPGTKPTKLIAQRGRDNLNISDIEGTKPRKSPLYYSGMDLILNIRDINGKIKEKPIPSSTIDYCINFSNPHLGKRSHCWNANSRLKYQWGGSSIKEVLFPSKEATKEVTEKINKGHVKESKELESSNKRDKVIPKSVMYAKPILDSKCNIKRAPIRPDMKSYIESPYKNQK